MNHGADCELFHQRLKKDAKLWRLLVIDIGELRQQNGDALTIGNCRICWSTIARPAQTSPPTRRVMPASTVDID
jgi:hypothetical protein